MTDVAGFASSFVSAVVNFLIMALILFCLMKGINKLLSFNKKEEAPAEPTTRHVHFARVKSASRQPVVHTVLLYWKKNKSGIYSRSNCRKMKVIDEK